MQQIYISEETWTAIVAAKKALSVKLKNIANQSKDANSFRENILIEFSNSQSPTDTAIVFIKNEVRKLL